MTRSGRVAVVAGVIALAGCANPWPQRVTDTGTCHGQHCEVSVAAMQYDMPQFGCHVDRISPYNLQVKHPRPMTVQWYLEPLSVAQGYRFADPGGITFDNPAGWECRVLPTGTKAQCLNNAGAGEHKYTVRVVKGTAACEPHDPLIIND